MNHPIALVTGGNRGLGRSTAVHLVQRGVDLILTYRANAAEAQAVVGEIEALGRRAIAIALDVGDSANFAETVKTSLQHGWKRERFDYLVNNAGVGVYAPFAEFTEAQFDTLINVHLKGPFFLTQKLLPLLNDGGRIVNISTGLTRFSLPDDIGGAVSALLQSDNRWVNAQRIEVSGGQFI